MGTDAYREAGVDIDAGDALVDRIKPMAKSTHRPGVIGGIGGFGGLFSLMGRYRDPVLVSGTDGVGTKLLIAQRLVRHDTIGIDLVAMCVNDILVSGAEPLFFLDYFATGKLSVDEAAEVVSGIAEGCRQANCALLGGETAEMPGMYAPGHYDLAGFAVGAVERDRILDGARIQAGDALIGLPSSGLHSNGYSLVRKLLDRFDAEQEHGLGAPLGEVLLRPTKIYVRQVLPLLEKFDVRGMAHITGGGLVGNVPRMFPPGIGGIARKGWETPPIFDLLRFEGKLDDAEMFRTFNAGVGLVICVPADQADGLVAETGGFVLGETREDPAGELEIS